MDGNRSNIDKLNEDIYKRSFEDTEQSVRPEFTTDIPKVSREWKPTPKKEEPHLEKPPMPLAKKIFLVSLGFFTLSAFVAVSLFFSGGNLVSSDNIDIKIIGPTSIAGGEELSLQLVLTNENPAPIEYAEIFIDYPEGAHTATDVSKELVRENIHIGTVRSGESVSELVKSVLFGREGEERRIGITLEYRVQGSNAIFFKEKEYVVGLSSSPLSVDMTVLGEVSSNQAMSVEVSVSSNSDSTLEDLLLRIEYPFGFTPSTANPKPAFSNNIWDIGDLQPKGKTKISVNGIIKGQDNEEKIFKVYVGKRDQESEREIATVYSTTFEETTIKRPFIGVQLGIDGDFGDDHVAESGESIRGTITYTNNLPNQITDAVIEVALLGDALSIPSVVADRGFYDSGAKKIIWDKTALPDLSVLEPGQTGRLSFTFASKSLASTEGSRLRNPEINISVSTRGQRQGESSVLEQITNVISKTVRIGSEVKFSTNGFFFTGPFVNTGTLPPKVGNQITYTASWKIENTSNDLSGLKVRAILPSYIKWTGTISPSSADISFNPQTSEIIWNAGDLAPRQIKEVAYQISFTPSLSQVTQAPDLVTSIVLTGKDDFSNRTFEIPSSPLSTRLSPQSGILENQATVTE